MPELTPLRIGMVGYSFMGAVHSHAWRSAPRFFDLPLRPELTALAGRDRQAAGAAADRMGWASVETDWRRLVERDDIDLIDICSPGNTHPEIAVAALQAGKHVLCEKPLANTLAEAQTMADAAAAAAEHGVFAMCGFTYRRTPAIALAKQFIEEGRIGTVRQVRAQYLQDWLADENAPLTWRLDKEQAGSGALGDIGAHIVDAAQFVTGLTVTGVSGLLETFVKERPRVGALVGLGGRAESATAADKGPVTVDDAALFTARFEGGAIGIFEATRFATGRKNAMRLEVSGSLGALSFDFEEMNVLHLFDGTDDIRTQGFRRILVTEPEHPYAGHWWPAGHGLGYEHGFTHQVVDLITAIASGAQPSPSFGDAAQVQRVLDGVQRSAEGDSRWQRVSD
ncbi:MAG: Gfo/Idh/MocA family protein [Microbacteriaceae bacterium]